MIRYAALVKPAAILLVLATVAGGSWTARGWLEDSKALAAMAAQQQLADAIRGDMAQVAKAVDSRLQSLRATERIIDRGIIREIQQPVYRNVCLPPDGDAFRLLNALALGQAPSSSAGEGAGDTPAVE